MRKFIWIFVILTLLLAGCELDSTEPTGTEAPAVTAPPTTPTEPAVLEFLNDFTQYGYTAEQIEAMRTILVNVGIAEISNLEIGALSYGMQTVKGIAFTTGEHFAPQEVQVRFNIENGVLYMVAIYCPSYGHENQTPYLSGLTDRRADLYYDTDGGYLKKIDWENRAVVDYGE